VHHVFSAARSGASPVAIFVIFCCVRRLEQVVVMNQLRSQAGPRSVGP
jgi:hypothetical protein